MKSDPLQQQHWSTPPGGGKWGTGCPFLPPPVFKILSCHTDKISMKGWSLGSSSSLSNKDPPAKATFMLQEQYSGISVVGFVFVPWVSMHRDGMGNAAWSVCRKGGHKKHVSWGPWSSNTKLSLQNRSHRAKEVTSVTQSNNPLNPLPPTECTSHYSPSAPKCM